MTPVASSAQTQSVPLLASCPTSRSVASPWLWPSAMPKGEDQVGGRIWGQPGQELFGAATGTRERSQVFGRGQRVRAGQGVPGGPIRLTAGGLGENRPRQKAGGIRQARGLARSLRQPDQFGQNVVVEPASGRHLQAFTQDAIVRLSRPQHAPPELREYAP